MLANTRSAFASDELDDFVRRDRNLNVDVAGAKQQLELVQAALGRVRGLQQAANGSAEQDFVQTVQAVTECVIRTQAHKLDDLTRSFRDLESHTFVDAFVARAREVSHATPAQLATLQRDLAKCWGALPRLLSSIRSDDEWRQVLRAYQPASRSQDTWGFPACASAEVPEPLIRFVSTFRAAGVTPSLYLVLAVAAFLTHGHGYADQASAE